MSIYVHISVNINIDMDNFPHLQCGEQIIGSKSESGNKLGGHHNYIDQKYGWLGSCHCGGCSKLLNFKYILKVELIGFAAKVNVGYERRIRMTPRFLAQAAEEQCCYNQDKVIRRSRLWEIGQVCFRNVEVKVSLNTQVKIVGNIVQVWNSGIQGRNPGWRVFLEFIHIQIIFKAMVIKEWI